MPRRRKITWLAALLVLAGGFGGYCWYQQSTAVDRKVCELVYEAAEYPDSRTEKFLKEWKLEFLLRDKPKPRAERVIQKEMMAIGHAATPELISLLQNDVVWIRCKAADFLGDVGDQRAVEPLIQVLLNDSDGNPPEHAVYALGKLRDIRALEPIKQAMQIRIQSAKADRGDNEYAIYGATLVYLIAINNIESAARSGAATSPASRP